MKTYTVVSPDGSRERNFATWYSAFDWVRDEDEKFEAKLIADMRDAAFNDETFFRTDTADWIWENGDEMLADFGYKIVEEDEAQLNGELQ